MSDDLDSEILEHVQVLIGDSEINSIYFEEVSARRSGIPLSEASNDEIEPTHGLHIGRSDDGERFRIKLRTEIDTNVGFIVSEVAIEYELNEIDVREVGDDVMLAFANHVAVMTLIPYVRQSIADITLRVFDSALTMPMIARGELVFNPEDLIEDDPSVGTDAP